jgi:hypothetical protein
MLDLRNLKKTIDTYGFNKIANQVRTEKGISGSFEQIITQACEKVAMHHLNEQQIKAAIFSLKALKFTR